MWYDSFDDWPRLPPTERANVTRIQYNTIQYKKTKLSLSLSLSFSIKSTPHSITQNKNVLMKFLGNLIWNIVLKIRFLSVCCCFAGNQNGESIFMIEKKKKKESRASIMCYYEYFCCFREVFV